MGMLPMAEAAIFEEHYLACPGCAAALQDAGQYVGAIAAAARRIRQGGGQRSVCPQASVNPRDSAGAFSLHFADLFFRPRIATK